MIKREKSELEKAQEEKEKRRQAGMKSYVEDRISECLYVVECEQDYDGNVTKAVRKIAKVHPVSSRHTIEAYRSHVKAGNTIAIEFPNLGARSKAHPQGEPIESIRITAQTGDPDPVTNVKAKEPHTIKLGAARGMLMKVPYLKPEDDRGSATCDLLFAIQEFVELCNVVAEQEAARVAAEQEAAKAAQEAAKAKVSK